MAVLQHHEIADVFPMCDAPEIERLAADIAANGLRHRIVLFDGKILDGRNRYRASQLVRYKTPDMFVEFPGDWDAAVKFVTSENLHRRHLTVSQLAMCAQKLATLKEGRPAKTASNEAVSQVSAAEIMGVSRSSVQRAKRVRDQGVPELAAAVENDEINLGAAERLTELPKDEQRQVLAAGRKKVKETVAELRDPPARRRKTAPTSADQAARQQLADVDAMFFDLSAAIRRVEGAAQQLASGTLTLTAEQTDLGLVVVGRLQSGAGWLETLFKGEGFSDDALSTWLSGGEQS